MAAGIQVLARRAVFIYVQACGRGPLEALSEYFAARIASNHGVVLTVLVRASLVTVRIVSNAYLKRLRI